MTRKQTPVGEPEVSVRNKTEVTLSASAVEHALRYHLMRLAVDRAVPRPAFFNDVWVQVYLDEDGSLLSATLTYEPEVSVAQTQGDNDGQG